MRRLLALLFFTITLGIAQGAYAGPYQDALAAYGRGDYATALSLLRPLAAQGNATAQFVLGMMYNYGQGVVQDYKEAMKWSRLAAAQGDVDAQYMLGEMYDLGQGVVQNYVRAHMWFMLSVANGATYASKNRDKVAKKLTSAQIAQAQEIEVARGIWTVG